MKSHIRSILFFLFCLSVLLLPTGCTDIEPLQITSSKPLENHLRVEPVRFSDLPHWRDTDTQRIIISNQKALKSLKAFQKSCAKILRQPAEKNFGALPEMGKVHDWQKICAKIPSELNNYTEKAQSFFEDNFTPYLMLNGSNSDGLFTGYYEPTLYGSLARSPKYNIPLRSRPSDLVMVNLGEFRDTLKGQRIAGRVVNGQLKPYEDRAEIDDGKLPANVDHALVWVDSYAAAFFLQIQGSGIVVLEDSTVMRVGYDGQNGHVYTAIGKELVEKNILSKDNVSMQTILNWLKENPQKGIELMRTNRSYVFFKRLDTIGPVGAQGVILTPEHSLAVDPVYVPYGSPIFLDINHPDPNITPPLNDRIQQLVIAQDTGGAITGPIRGDLFWGYGGSAERKAGVMKSKGKAYILLPKEISKNNPLVSAK